METSKLDIADYLDNNEMIAEYLNTVLAEGNESDVITAIGHIAKSIGMTKMVHESGEDECIKDGGVSWSWCQINQRFVKRTISTIKRDANENKNRTLHNIL